MRQIPLSARLLPLALCLVLASAATAQERPAEPEPVMETLVRPTSDSVRLAGFARKQALLDASLVRNVPFRNVGPTIMSGRVVDLDVSPVDPTHFYVAYASGGLWKTTSNGTAFTPLFDRESAMTIGDIAVDWTNGETIWVGTGENNSSRSSYAGTGVFKSTDGGENWEHMGLVGTQHTGRIVLHPSDASTVWVAAMGPLYSPGRDRGVYKTTDGGRSWRRTLFVDDNTGAIDLVMDPSNPLVLYAAMWHRERRAWNFVESGPGSGIFKSVDGGENWRRMNIDGSGFPTGEGVGRIGLAIYPGNPEILFALLDNQYRQTEEEDEDRPALTRGMLREMTREAFLQVGTEALADYLKRNGFPASYTAESILEMVRDGEIEPIALVEYLEDANQRLFDTPVIGGELYRSEDGGRSWRRTHEEELDEFYYSYGYYFGEVRVAPDDPDRLYVMGVPILKSEDGGATFASINGENVHVDHHALWVSPTRPGHLVNGNDGGVNVSFDDGATWFKANTPPVGQFYTVQVDRAEPYNVYGGTQDNGVWMGPSTYRQSYRWHGESDYPYRRLLGGDGMQVEVDTRTNDLVYTGFQFGNYFRIEQGTRKSTRIKPQHELGERPLRFNWNSPVHLSRHNQDILYFGSNRFHRSLDRGETWETLSEDLTLGGRPGDVPYGTLTTIHESPLRFGLVYVGSDDGLIHLSRDGGYTWQRISDALPPNLWVSRVEASRHEAGRIHISLNGYRWDHFEPYLFRSEDFGQSWRQLGTDLPAEPINVVAEDPSNPGILYVGTDHGVYVSLDAGESFIAMDGGMPFAPVHDLKIHPDARDLVVGTHGRSIYIADLTHVQQLTPALIAGALHLFTIDPVTFVEGWGARRATWAEVREPEITIPFYARAGGEASLRIKAEDGTLLRERDLEVDRGLNYATYNLTADPEKAARYEQRRKRAKEEGPQMEPANDGNVYLTPGTYTVEITMGGETAGGTFEVKAPPARSQQSAPIPGPEGEEETK